MAKALHGAGIRRNDIVGILCENRNEFAAISYGTIFLNAVLAPANYAYTERKFKTLKIFLFYLSNDMLSIKGLHSITTLIIEFY